VDCVASIHLQTGIGWTPSYQNGRVLLYVDGKAAVATEGSQRY